MYIPKHFKIDDEQEAIAFMQRYSFATLITAKNNYPEATHLPFLVEQVGDQLILSSHFAKANPQANDIGLERALIIFTEPHTYISPKNYERDLNVSTWNYIAIHAYGEATVVNNDDEKMAVLEKMIKFYEQDYLNQWHGLPMDYKLKMLNGIGAFTITVTNLQAKSKLSQNRSAAEKEQIIKALNTSPHSTEQEIGYYMTVLKNKDH